MGSGYCLSAISDVSGQVPLSSEFCFGLIRFLGNYTVLTAQHSLPLVMVSMRQWGARHWVLPFFNLIQNFRLEQIVFAKFWGLILANSIILENSGKFWS